MLMQAEITRKLQSAFEPRQAEVLLEVIGLSYENLVTVSDFNELKAIVQDLAESQKEMGETQKAMGESQKAMGETQKEMGETQKEMGETQKEMGESMKAMGETQKAMGETQKAMGETQKEMGESMKAMAVTLEETTSQVRDLAATVTELAVAQQRTDRQVANLTSVVGDIRSEIKELAVAQQRTDRQVANLTSVVGDIRSEIGDIRSEIGDIRSEIGDIRSEIGGMSRSMSYALENEAYRALPAFLLDKYSIEVTERLVRAPVNNEEINFLGRALRNGKPIRIVGESKQRLDERRSSKREEDRIFSQLETQADVARAVYPDEEIVLLLITHYARPEFLRNAAARGIIVVQSFEW